KAALVLVLLLRQACQGYDPLAFIDIDQSYALCVSADDPDIFDPKTYDLALVGDQHELIVFGDLLDTNHTASFVRGLHRKDSFAAARLKAVFIDRRALTKTILSDGKEVEAKAEDFHAHHRVALIEPHSDDTIGSATGWPNLLFFKTYRLSIGGGENNLLLSVRQTDTDDLVSIFQRDGANPIGTRIRVGHQLGFLYQALFCGEDNVAPLLKLADGQEGRNFFSGFEIEQIDNGFAPSGSASLRQLVNFDPINLADGRAKKNVRVHGTEEKALEKIFFSSSGADLSLAAAPLRAVESNRIALDVAFVGNGDRHVFVDDQVLDGDLLGLGNNLGSALVAILLLDLL